MTTRVLLIDIGEVNSGEIEIEVSQILASEIAGRPHVDAVPVAHCTLTSVERRARAKLADAVREAQEEYPGSSFLLGNPGDDAAVLQVEHHVDRLVRWDFELIVAPLLASLWSAGWGARSLVVLYPGSTLLEGFTLRWALRFGVLVGAISPDSLSRFICLPFWSQSEEPFLSLLCRVARVEGLPRVDPARTTLLLAPEPPGSLPLLLGQSDRSEWREIVEIMTLEIGLQKAGAALRCEVQALAAAHGVDVVGHATTEQLLARLQAPAPGHTLVLVAHQDGDGLHLADGRLGLVEIRDALRRIRDQGGSCYDTVDLAVCGASDPGNLGECFQAAGSTVVLTRGRYAYYGRTLAALCAALRLMESTGPLPLPVLVDEVWWGAVNSGRGAVPMDDR